MYNGYFLVAVHSKEVGALSTNPWRTPTSCIVSITYKVHTLGYTVYDYTCTRL